MDLDNVLEASRALSSRLVSEPGLSQLEIVGRTSITFLCYILRINLPHSRNRQSFLHKYLLTLQITGRHFPIICLMQSTDLPCFP